MTSRFAHRHIDRMHATKQRLIDAGLTLFLENGYSHLGLDAILKATGVPKGSFYHHFADKEQYALDVVDAYMAGVHQALDAVVHDETIPPLDRIRAFFGIVRGKYEEEGYLGCLMGGLGQELSGISPVFGEKIDACFNAIAEKLSLCLAAAKREGILRESVDERAFANILVDCWEGAALRSRLKRDPSALGAMLDFYLASVTAGSCGGLTS